MFELKNGSKCVPIETIKTDGTAYTLTINPKDQPSGSKRALLTWMRVWRDWFVLYKDTINIRLYLESSGTGRFHYHGLIKINNIFKFTFFLKALNESSHFEIDTISDNKKWLDYVLKQKHIFKNELSDYLYPIVVDGSSEFINKPVDNPVKLSNLELYGYSEDPEGFTGHDTEHHETDTDQ